MHNLLKDFYYSRQAPAQRMALHERAAEFYSIYSNGGIEGTYHLFKAGDFETGIVNLLSRGNGWLRQGYVDEVLNLIELIPEYLEGPEERYGIEFLTASAQDLLGDWNGASDHYGICFELARESESPEREAMVLRRQGAILYRRGEVEGARKIFDKALEVLGDSNERLQARIHGSLGVALWALGKAQLAREAHETDLAISTGAHDDEGIARALNNLGILDWESGDFGQALERYSPALEIAERLGDKKLVSILYSNIGDVLRSRGDVDEARRYYERCLELAEDLKFNWQIAEAHRGLAQVTEKKEKHLQRALAIFKRLGAEEDVKSVKQMMDR